METYQAKTRGDVENLRKLLETALRKEAELAAAEVKRGTVASPGPATAEVPLQLRFSWRNNGGVNKKKEIPFRLELAKAASGWKLASCQSTEKLNF